MSWIISHAISAVKSETPQADIRFVLPCLLGNDNTTRGTTEYIRNHTPGHPPTPARGRAPHPPRQRIRRPRGRRRHPRRVHRPRLAPRPPRRRRHPVRIRRNDRRIGRRLEQRARRQSAAAAPTGQRRVGHRRRTRRGQGAAAASGRPRAVRPAMAHHRHRPAGLRHHRCRQPTRVTQGGAR